MRSVCAFFLTFFPVLLLSLSITEDFSTTTYLSSDSTAVWNVAKGYAHPPLVIDRTAAGGENEDDLVEIGNGADGAFHSGTYDQFDTDDSDGTTVVTLDSTRIYHFTTFELDSGITLKGTGTTPLDIRVQGDVTIAGSVELNGTDGGDLTGDDTTAPSGGTTCCSGGNGGRGGTSSAAAAAGSGNGAGGLGTASGAASNGSGGGGGGGYETPGFNATAGTSPAGGGTGGAAGSAYGTVYLVPLVGGSGGGGGGVYTQGPSTSDGSGGGGGAGGGAVRFCAGGNVLVASGGSILAKGGVGGGTTSSLLLSGGGGGGAGGAIAIYALGTITINGAINASKGSGGTTPGGNGGDGAEGRTRIVDGPGTWVSLVGGNGSVSPSPRLAEFGKVFYRTASFQIQTVTIDTENRSPTFATFTSEETKPTGATITYAIAGSNDRFVSDDTGYVDPATNLSDLNGKRFFRVRITLQAASRTAPPLVESFTVNFDANYQSEFEFAMAGCAGVTRLPSDRGKIDLLGLIVLGLYLVTMSRKGKRWLESAA